MRLLHVKRTYRSLVRIKEILQVLTKHGFGHVVSRLYTHMQLPRMRQLRVPGRAPVYLPEDTVPVRLRMVLQELGPTFVKLGQILSGRPDLFPEAFIQELKVLQDHVPPFPTPKAKEIIATELGAPAHKIFPHFSDKVLASGSIGQVHTAELPDGTEVIVKVKRPDIDSIIATDVAILHFLAEMLEQYIEEVRLFQPVMIVEEFARTIRRELDFTAEAAYTEKFYYLLKDNAKIGSPKVFWQYTTPHVITLQKLIGTNIGEKAKLQEYGINIKTLAHDLAYSFTQQYLIWGIFHGDPHPGNILVSPSGKIFLVDFGMVGHLSRELQSQLATTLIALMRNDLEMVIEVYEDIGAFSEQVNHRDLKNDILEIMDKYFNTPFQRLDIGKIFEDIVRLARNHKIKLPRDFVLLGKSLVTVSTIARELDPDFNFARAASPHVNTILKDKFSPKRLFSLSVFHLWSLFSLLQRLPSDLKEILRLIRSGKLRLTLRLEALDRCLQEFEKATNRLSFSIVIGSILLSSSVLVLAKAGPQYHNISIFGLIGYMIAALLGMWLVSAVLRSGRL
jgi:ubiquinone biosynthesis protein